MLRYALVLFFWAAAAVAQNYPARPVKTVVPSSPGGATDAFSRTIGGPLAELRGRGVLVEIITLSGVKVE